MVKTTGPLFSKSASGTIGKTITHVQTRRRSIARVKVKPAQPRTDAQVGARAITAWLSTQWSTISDYNKATWAAVSDEARLSNYNAYQRENKRVWKQLLTPSTFYPRSPFGFSLNVFSPTATGIPAAIQLTWAVLGTFQLWGIALWRSNTPAFDTTPNKLLTIIRPTITWPNLQTYVDRTVKNQTYYYNSQAFSENGFADYALGELSAAPT